MSLFIVYFSIPMLLRCDTQPNIDRKPFLPHQYETKKKYQNKPKHKRMFFSFAVCENLFLYIKYDPKPTTTVTPSTSNLINNNIFKNIVCLIFFLNLFLYHVDLFFHFYFISPIIIFASRLNCLKNIFFK